MFSSDVEGIPLDLITTDDAIAAVIDLNSTVREWRAAGSPRRLTNSKRKNRAERLYRAAESTVTALVEDITAAVRDRKLRAVYWENGDDRKRKELPGRFWADENDGRSSLRGSLSVSTGKVRGHGQLEGRPLCFERVAWAAWVSERLGNDSLSRGRSGAGNKAYQEGDLVACLIAAVDNNEYKSDREATRAVMDALPGNGTIENRARRLQSKMSKARRAAGR